MKTPEEARADIMTKLSEYFVSHDEETSDINWTMLVTDLAIICALAGISPGKVVDDLLAHWPNTSKLEN